VLYTHGWMDYNADKTKVKCRKFVF